MPSFPNNARLSIVLAACGLSLATAGCARKSVHAAPPANTAPVPTEVARPMNTAPDTDAAPPGETVTAPPPLPTATTPPPPAITSAKPPAPRKPAGPPAAEPETPAHPPAPQIAPQLSPSDQASYERKTSDDT